MSSAVPSITSDVLSIPALSSPTAPSESLYDRRAASMKLAHATALAEDNTPFEAGSSSGTDTSSTLSMPTHCRINNGVPHTVEQARLDEDQRGEQKWKKWGPYVSERQWATVREDYSADGDAWSHFPHDHARSRAYRWGEDGLAGFSDDKGLLCWSLGLWNGEDEILKERLFGVTGHEGNHGEDVKELYYYLDSTVSSLQSSLCLLINVLTGLFTP